MRAERLRASAPPLDWEISPASIEFSSPDGPLSIVSLTISGRNLGASPIEIKRISVVVPQGTSSSSGALTTDASIIGGAAGATTPWAVLSGGNGTWTLVPLPPATGMGAGETIALVLTNVVVNDVAGDVDIEISVETTDIDKFTRTVRKTTESTRGGELPTIDTFAAEPTMVALGGRVELSWRVANAESGVLQPGGIPIPDPSEGRLPLDVYATEIFELDVAGFGGTVSASVTVAVVPVEIRSFFATPDSPVAPGDSVTLTWATEYASSVSIDQGVGLVANSGQVIVRPKQTTIYTLTAQGLNPQTRAVTVEVQPTR